MFKKEVDGEERCFVLEPCMYFRGVDDKPGVGKDI
jgi:hypothetical protein